MSGAGPRKPVNTEDLFRAHAPFVARFLTRLGVGAAELDDAVQEVFLVAHRNGGYVPGPATPTGYLGSIAVRAAASYRRRGRKSRDRKSDVAPDEVSSAGLDPARSLEVHQSLAELQDALDGLEPDLRATLVLAELEGESCLSIAATMQIAVGTVYWRLHRARKTFRQAIENRRVAERHAEGLAAGAFLFGRSADGLLDAGRAHPGVPFDTASALERLREALRLGGSIPAWAAAAGISSGVGLTAPAVLSALVMVHAVGSGVSRWRADVASARSPPAAILSAIAPDFRGEAAVAVAAPPAPAGATALRDPTYPRYDVGQGVARGSPGPLPVTRATPVEPFLPAQRPVPGSSQAEADPPTAAGPVGLVDPSSTDAMREIQDVAAAQHLLASNPAQALSLARTDEARFPTGYLREERRYVGVVALFNLGRLEEARAEAMRFLADYPDGPFTARVRAWH